MKHTIKSRSLPSGVTSFIDPATGRQVITGSATGRGDSIPNDFMTVKRMRLVRLLMTSDGCYDQGGAYWGQGAPLFWAYGDSETERAEKFIRANSREEAKAKVRASFPNITFFR